MLEWRRHKNSKKENALYDGPWAFIILTDETPDEKVAEFKKLIEPYLSEFKDHAVWYSAKWSKEKGEYLKRTEHVKNLCLKQAGIKDS